MYDGFGGGVNTLFVGVAALISITFLAAKAAGLAFRGGGGGKDGACFDS